MANTTFFHHHLLRTAIFHLAAAQQRYYNITQGSSLKPTGNSSWQSPSGLYAFGFYQLQPNKGYVIGIVLASIPEKTVVWTANRDNPPVSDDATLLLTTEGKLVLQQAQGETTDIVQPPQFISLASMMDSGNFVLYDSNQQIMWQSFDHPTDTLLPGQQLSNGQEMFSSASTTDPSTGIFRLKLQSDGKLAQYPVGTPDNAAYSYWDLESYTTGVDVYWDSETDTSGENVKLNLDVNGHIYLFNSSSIVKNITESRRFEKQTIYLMKIDADGIFRLYKYKDNMSIEWSSSGDKCDPMGLCGLNAFCTLIDDKPHCECVPGFDYVKVGNWSSGCERNYTAESCKDENTNITYRMRSLDYVQWEDISYSVINNIAKGDCEASCIEDCNCEAALFQDMSCKKQSLPLRYARRLLTDPTIALIKVASPKHLAVEVQPDLQKGSKEKTNVRILIIGISIVGFAFTLFLISGLLVYRIQVWPYKKILAKRDIEMMEGVAPRSFTYAELVEVTSDFRDQIGRGAFGTVFKGTLQNNQKLVAVKRLNKVLAEGESEFQNEMKVIGRTHHRNLVRLLGYSVDGPERLLVYDYMINGSLADLLFAPELRPSWDERIKIALDIARGVLYLHEECETQIIHCDIKPQNILMNECRQAKISDFGLAKLLQKDQTNTYTGIRGTRGYVAPEWHRKMPITVKADVYSFGIVLLEIICCRRSVDLSFPEEEGVLEDWVYQCFENRELHKLVVHEETDRKRLERMVRVGLWCIQDDPSLRPSMKKILLMLEGTVDIPVPPSPTSYLSAL